MTDITDLIYKEFTQYCTTDEKYMSRQNLAYDALEALKITLGSNNLFSAENISNFRFHFSIGLF